MSYQEHISLVLISCKQVLVIVLHKHYRHTVSAKGTIHFFYVCGCTTLSNKLCILEYPLELLAREHPGILPFTIIIFVKFSYIFCIYCSKYCSVTLLLLSYLPLSRVSFRILVIQTRPHGFQGSSTTEILNQESKKYNKACDYITIL